MKLMNKLGLFAIAFLSLILFTGCGKKVENVEGTLEEIMTKVYANYNDSLAEDERPMLSNIVVDKENVEGFLGTADIEFEEALASEPMMSSIAHSVVLVRVSDDADVEATMQKIKENVNPRKWLCVGVEEDQVIVKNKGNLIILIMVAENSDKIEAGFDSL